MTMKKRIIAIACAAVMLLSLAACGKEKTNEFNSGFQPVGQDQTFEEPTGTGFDQNHAVEAGFGMGADTVDDIIGRYGQPEEQSINEYTMVTVASLSYPFGIFEFEGAPGTTPVLTYVQINAQYAAPCGVLFGDNIEAAANKILTGSGSGLMTAAETEKYFYGSDAAGVEYGLYKMLTIEFIGTNTKDAYALEYRTKGYEADRYTTLTLYFNGEYNMTWYSLRYVR